MKKIISGDIQRKRKILKENSCPIRSLFAIKKKKKAVHVELARTRKFVLQIFFCFSRHITLVWQGL